MHHPVHSFPLKLEYPLQTPGGITFDYNYNYNHLNSNVSSGVALTSNSLSSPSPSTSSNMAKRALSDSDCEDLFTDTKDSCMTPPGSDAGGGGGNNVSRKKRRGIIEKRRRDRINNSLSELRRLVPTAFEKQGSAKLEKAEILQMTVDHLKMLHSKGLDALAYDPHKVFIDYYSSGFRECAAEVGRYLLCAEGMDSHDPVRLRLLSHLQCYAAQRELANKQASASSSWGFSPLTPNHSYPLTPTHHLASSSTNSVNPGGLVATPLQPPPQHPSTLMDGSPSSHQQTYLNTSSSSSGSSSHTSPSTMGHDNGLPQGHLQMSQRTLFPPPPPNHSHIPIREYTPNGNPMASAPYGMNNHQNYPVQSGKPYRPWGGAELAY